MTALYFLLSVVAVYCHQEAVSQTPGRQATLTCDGVGPPARHREVGSYNIQRAEVKRC